jgi:hypothetical protein
MTMAVNTISPRAYGSLARMSLAQDALTGATSPAPADSFALSGGQSDAAGTMGIVDLIKRREEVPVAEVKSAVPAACAEIVTETIKAEEDRYTIDMSYPQIKGGIGEEQRTLINRQLEAWVRTEVSDFKSFALEAEPVEGLSSSLEGGFTEIANNARFISVTMGESSYVAGCAHPSHRVLGFNFNPETGSAISFRELFKLPDDEPEVSNLFRDNTKAREEREMAAIRRVSDLSIRELLKQNEGTPEDERIDEESIREIAAPEEGKFDNFNLTDGGLMINFEFCHAIGCRDVTIPYRELADILDPDSVLGSEAKRPERKPPSAAENPEMDITDDMIIIDDVRVKINKGK